MSSQRRKSTAGKSTVKKRRGGKANLGVEFQAARPKGTKRKGPPLVTPKSTGKKVDFTVTNILQLLYFATRPTFKIKITFKGSDSVLSKKKFKNRNYKKWNELDRKNREALGRKDGKFDDPTDLYVLTIKKIIHQYVTKKAIDRVKLNPSDTDFYHKVEKVLNIQLTIDVNGDKSEIIRNQIPGRLPSRLQQEAMADDLPFVNNMVIEEESEAPEEEEFSEEESEAQLTAEEYLGESLFLGLKF
tara:strand:+ start:101 stop:832 length:732 start_codon:yes stop_codon:yes gene_type:complete